ELRSVTDLLDAPAGSPLPLVMFYGVPGIGKTSLLERLEQSCEERAIPWAGADLAKAPDARQALECLARQLTGPYGLALPLRRRHHRARPLQRVRSLGNRASTRRTDGLRRPLRRHGVGTARQRRRPGGAFPR